MFYKHLHDPSCDLFTHGEEAPQSKEAQLQAALDAERAENECKDTLIETLQAQLRQVEGELADEKTAYKKLSEQWNKTSIDLADTAGKEHT